jgi:hypothetical protein
MAVSLIEYRSPWPKLTDDQRTLVNRIMDTLDEKSPLARRQIARIVLGCGEAFAQGILDDTLKIEAEGGLWLSEHNRRRTPGGVYLYLARQLISPQIGKLIFTRKRKKSKSKKPMTGDLLQDAAVPQMPARLPQSPRTSN